MVVANQSQGEKGNPKITRTLLVGIAIKRVTTVVNAENQRRRFEEGKKFSKCDC